MNIALIKIYHNSQHAEHVSTQSAVVNTMSAKVKKQNRKNLMKKQNKEKQLSK